MSNITINMGTMNGNIIQTDCAGNCGSGKEPENSKERCSQDKELQNMNLISQFPIPVRRQNMFPGWLRF